MTSLRIAIVGGGIAGAATAYFLARRGVREIRVYEGENDLGFHSTGRNAAILRTAMEDPAHHPLARQSADFYRNPPEDFCAHPLIAPVGLYLGATADGVAGLEAWANDPACHTGLAPCDPAEIQATIPLFEADRVAVAYRQADEGTLDVHAIHEGFLHGARAAGTQIQTGATVTAVRTDGGAVSGIEVGSDFEAADAVVLAGGAWAAQLGNAIDAPVALAVRRRHLLVTQPLDSVDPHWPVVWVGGDEFYFRPESGGLLVCPCDTDVVTPEQSIVPNAAMRELAAEKVSRWLPELTDAGAAHFWSGARTFAPDGRFVLGPDKRIAGLHWAAGLGGHGITCGAEVGRLVADALLDGPSAATEPFAPTRASAQSDDAVQISAS